jgi:hypothetical protein
MPENPTAWGIVREGHSRLRRLADLLNDEFTRSRRAGDSIEDLFIRLAFVADYHIRNGDRPQAVQQETREIDELLGIEDGPEAPDPEKEDEEEEDEKPDSGVTADNMAIDDEKARLGGISLFDGRHDADIEEMLPDADIVEEIKYDILLPKHANHPKESGRDGKLGPSSIAFDYDGILFGNKTHAYVWAFFHKMGFAIEYNWLDNPGHVFRILTSDGKDQICTFVPHFFLADYGWFLYVWNHSDSPNPVIPTRRDFAAMCYSETRILGMKFHGMPSSRTLLIQLRGSCHKPVVRETLCLDWDYKAKRGILEPTRELGLPNTREWIDKIHERWKQAKDDVDRAFQKAKDEGEIA